MTTGGLGHALGLVFSLLVWTGSVRAQVGGQDNWVYTGRQLSVPDVNVARKCITISAQGIYVGTMNSGATAALAIEQYTPEGQYVKKWSAVFGNLSGLASDQDGNVYAFDVPQAKVSVFDSQGTLIRSWGSAGSGDGQFSATSGTMVHAIAVDSQKNVYVADWGNSRIQVFDSTGTFVRKFGQSGTLPGQFQSGPAAVAITPDGNVLAYDSTVNWYHLVRFTAVGAFLNRSPQSTNYTIYTGYEAYNGGAAYGLGGDRVFSVSGDGALAVGSENGTSYGATPGVTRVIAPINAFNGIGAVTFSSYVTTRGGAFDPKGNLWAVRDKKVECVERRMRFDVHKPVTALPQPVILSVSQPNGSQTVDIDYRVNDVDSPTVETALMGFIGGTRSFAKLVVPKTFVDSTAGKLGPGVATGGTIRVSWNAPADLSGQSFTNLAFEVIAKDDRAEVGVHYVTLPADSTYPQPLKISNKPVQEDDLADLWYWLLAKGDSRVALSGGSVALTAAGQSYVSGAPTPLTGTNLANIAHNGTVSTLQGRAFAYKLMNCRPVTAAEKTRAAAGKFNLNSVTDNSVVNLLP